MRNSGFTYKEKERVHMIVQHAGEEQETGQNIGALLSRGEFNCNLHRSLIP